MKNAFLISAIWALTFAQCASADVILSLFPDNNQNPSQPLTLEGTNGQSKQVGFKIDNNTSFYLLFNSYTPPPLPGQWTDNFLNIAVDFVAPNSSFSGLFGTYTFPQTGTGIVSTHPFQLNYSRYDLVFDAGGEIIDAIEVDPSAITNAVDANGNTPSIQFSIVPSTEPPPNVIPEPSTVALVAAGTILLVIGRRKA